MTLRSLRARVAPTFLVVALGCAGRHPTGPDASGGLSSANALAEQLRQHGATVTIGEVLPTSSYPFFSTRARLVSLNANDVVVFVYPSASAADADSAKVAADGTSVGTSKISWIAPPHFYRSGTLVVIYAGTSAAALQPLTAVLGPQFAPR